MWKLKRKGNFEENSSCGMQNLCCMAELFMFFIGMEMCGRQKLAQLLLELHAQLWGLDSCGFTFGAIFWLFIAGKWKPFAGALCEWLTNSYFKRYHSYNIHVNC